MFWFADKKINLNNQTSIIRWFAVFIVSSVVIFLLISLFFLLPRISKVFNDLQDQSEQATVEVYAAQFRQYVADRELSLNDMASSQLLINRLLLNVQLDAVSKDYISSLRVLGEDPDIEVFNFQGDLLFSEYPGVCPDEEGAINLILQGNKDFVLRLLVDDSASYFKMFLPIFYGNSREGVLAVRLSANPLDIFVEGKQINDSSAVQYSQKDVVVSSRQSMIKAPYRKVVDISEYNIELAHITDGQYIQQQKHTFIREMVYVVVSGAVLMLMLLYFLGRRIILQPYKSLVETQQAIEQAVEGISFIDVQGCYVSLNSAYANAAGYMPEELECKPWSVTVYDEDLSALQKAYDEMLQVGQVTREARGVKKDGSIFYKQVTMVAQYHDGIFVGHHCFMKDISKAKEAELEREQLIDKLMESNEWLEQFAFACSHDLQEPLRMVRIFSAKLQQHLLALGVEDEKAQRYLDYILQGSNRSQALISDILVYSRIDRDVERLALISLNDLMGSLMSELEELLENKTGKLLVDPLPEVLGNKTQLYQLFQNLVTNAIKYQSKDADPVIHIGFEDMESCWKIYVKDNGIGIDEKYHQSIFNIFKRLHTQMEYAGSGVGLAICKKVVERHGGLIWVDSELGKGSTFYFTLLKAAK